LIKVNSDEFGTTALRSFGEKLCALHAAAQQERARATRVPGAVQQKVLHRRTGTVTDAGVILKAS
jgi:hypothetical protein